MHLLVYIRQDRKRLPSGPMNLSRGDTTIASCIQVMIKRQFYTSRNKLLHNVDYSVKMLLLSHGSVRKSIVCLLENRCLFFSVALSPQLSENFQWPVPLRLAAADFIRHCWHRFRVGTYMYIGRIVADVDRCARSR